MDITKRNKLIEWLTFVFLVIFPFGQLVKVGIVNGLDIIAGAFLAIYLITRPKKPIFHKYARNFFWIALFSLIFSIFLFNSFNALYGGLYLLRLIAYYALFVVILNSREKPFDSLIGVSSAVAVFGWLQYFLYPDLRALWELGWDDHLYRLVGTFLDPTFTGIILTFGFLLVVAKLVFHPRGGSIRLILVALFLLVSVVFTYSRASFLALLLGSATVLYLEKKTKALAVTAVVLLVVIFFLPKGVGEGQKLERVASIYAKLTNYTKTIQIFQKSPIFGVGFNNICLAKQIYFKDINTQSHSCGGADSSLLLVLATTGVIGGFAFARLAFALIKNVKRNFLGIAFLGCLTALFIHSLFANSLFYPWVLGYLAILGGEVYRD